MKHWTKTFISASVVALGMVTGSAMAQQTPPGPTTAPGPQTAPTQAPMQNFTNEQLTKFLSASEHVVGISQQYQPQLDASKDDAARQKVYREADEQMVKVVRDKGLSVDEFNAINQALQRDPALAERLRKMANK